MDKFEIFLLSIPSLLISSIMSKLSTVSAKEMSLAYLSQVILILNMIKIHLGLQQIAYLELSCCFLTLVFFRREAFG